MRFHIDLFVNFMMMIFNGLGLGRVALDSMLSYTKQLYHEILLKVDYRLKCKKRLKFREGCY